MNWLRWHLGTACDPKWRVVAAESGARVTDVVAVWALMLERARGGDVPGTLGGWSDKVAAAALDLSPELVASIRGAMQGLVLDGEALTGWARRQPLREDGAAERARRWREQKRKQEEDENGSERTRTHANANERTRTKANAGERNRTPEQNRTEENREEESTSVRTARASDDGRTESIEEMKADINEYAKKVPKGPKRTSFAAAARILVMGDDGAAWHDTTGSPLPWAARPSMLRVAISLLEQGKSRDLRSALRYCIPRETDPIPTATASEAVTRRRREDSALEYSPPPMRSVEEIEAEQRERARESEERRRVEEQRVAEWEAANQLTARLLQREVSETVDATLADLPAGMRERTAAATYRERVLDLLQQEAHVA
jgi:hypothetical protein